MTQSQQESHGITLTDTDGYFRVYRLCNGVRDLVYGGPILQEAIRWFNHFVKEAQDGH